MKIRPAHRVGGRDTNTRPAVTTLAAAVAAVLAGAAGSARAQESGKVLEEVVVTGIRHSIETSIATKRESTSIVEVVSAEDIGKLPDTSIADSLARLPGVRRRATQRAPGGELE
jgi:iron complex outermembrane recepter protein